MYKKYIDQQCEIKLTEARAAWNAQQNSEGAAKAGSALAAIEPTAACYKMCIRDRYNASEMDAKVALQTKRGLALLADAGEELIQNTFVLVSDFKYMSHEEMIDKAKETSDAVQKISGRTNVGLSLIHI